MPYEDPIEAMLRSLTDVEWKKRDGRFEARINHTHLVGIQEILADYHITVAGEVSALRSGRYIATIDAGQMPAILKAVKLTGAKVKPHRRKWHS
ncbi:MAG: hypothetical protein SFW64_06435 [Alphaproteobacteria bacterium]|nr:hypothetical protein [Alphaproteobacteria bacterium]